MENTKNAIKTNFLEEFLPGENPDELTDSVPLMTGGILNSLASLNRAAFFEEKFRIEIYPHESSADYTATIADFSKLVHSN